VFLLFWKNKSWLVVDEEFQDQLKSTRHDLGFLSIFEGDIFAPLVINSLCKDFNILVILEKLIQGQPPAHYQLSSQLIMVISKFKKVPWLSLIKWDQIAKVKNCLNMQVILVPTTALT